MMRTLRPVTLSVINENQRFDDGFYHKPADRTPSPCLSLPKSMQLATILEGESATAKCTITTMTKTTTTATTTTKKNKNSVNYNSKTSNGSDVNSHNSVEDDVQEEWVEEGDEDDDTVPWVHRFSDIYNISNFFSRTSRNFDPTNRPPGLEGVKAMANRLKLATRRPSYQKWRDQYIDTSGVPCFPPLTYKEDNDGRLTEDRKERINIALEWIKRELGEMRTIDHTLATQLLTLRNEIHKLKLERSCENHQDLLDDVKEELTERETLSAVCDIPYDMADDNPLKQIGVTRMNISSRRFSMR